MDYPLGHYSKLLKLHKNRFPIESHVFQYYGSPDSLLIENRYIGSFPYIELLKTKSNAEISDMSDAERINYFSMLEAKVSMVQDQNPRVALPQGALEYISKPKKVQVVSNGINLLVFNETDWETYKTSRV